MLRQFLITLTLMAGLTSAGAQTTPPLEELGQQWTGVTIGGVADGTLTALLRSFDRTWHTAAVGDALGMMAQGKSQRVWSDEASFEGLYDAKNDYVEVISDYESSESMQACCRRRADGHRLLAVMLGSHAEGDRELLMTFDYDPQAGTLTPDTAAIGELPAVTDLNMMRIHELPQAGDELEVLEYFGDDVTLYRFAWDGQRFRLGKKTRQCYDCGPVEEDGGTYFQLTSETADPGIGDFVDFYFNEGEVLPELLGAIHTAWRRFKLGKTLPANTSLTLDRKNGYMRYERKWRDGCNSVAEMCFWNCADGQHKMVALSIATYENGSYLSGQYDGFDFYRYDAATRRMEILQLDDIYSGDNAWLDMSATALSLPRRGKDIVARRYEPKGVETMVLRWTGSGFAAKGSQAVRSKEGR